VFFLDIETVQLFDEPHSPMYNHNSKYRSNNSFSAKKYFYIVLTNLRKYAVIYNIEKTSNLGVHRGTARVFAPARIRKFVRNLSYQGYARSAISSSRLSEILADRIPAGRKNSPTVSGHHFRLIPRLANSFLSLRQIFQLRRRPRRYN